MAVRKDPENSEINALQAYVGSFAGKRVLEVGCGDGRLTWQYAEQAALVHGIDPDEMKIKVAREKTAAHLHTHVNFRVENIETFTASEKYDIILLSWSL